MKTFVSPDYLLHLIVLLTFINGDPVFSQTGQGGPETNIIQTGVPFLMIVPDARAAGMGEAGAATQPDVNAQYWNAAKYPFMDSRFGASLSYTPWLPALIHNVYLTSLAAFYKIDNRQVLSASFRSFSDRHIISTRSFSSPQGIYLPGELAIDAGYSRKLSENLSWGMVLRYVRSDLTGMRPVAGGDPKPAVAIAGDLGIYYRTTVLSLRNLGGNLGLAAQLANVGNKIAYTMDAEKAFLPINLRLGGALTIQAGDHHSISMVSDLNKLLVPTPPVWLTTSEGNIATTPSGQPIVLHGRNPYVSTPAGMLQSFWDAPGVPREDGSRSRWQEEINEISVGVGLEYWFHGTIAARGGYFHEHPTKGSRRFFTVGIGLHYKYLSLDGSWLIPAKSGNHLADTYRLTLSLGFPAVSLPARKAGDQS